MKTYHSTSIAIPASDVEVVVPSLQMQLSSEESSPRCRTLNCDTLLAEMELRKMLRRWRGHRELSTIAAPLFWLMLIYAVPFVILDLHLTEGTVCTDTVWKGGRSWPCNMNMRRCEWLGEVNGTFSYACTGASTNVTEHFLAASVSSMGSGTLTAFFSVVLLYFTGGSFIYRWYLYMVASVNAVARFSFVLCLQLDTCVAYAPILEEFSFDAFTGPVAILNLVLLLLLAAFSTHVMTILPYVARKRWLRFSPHNIRRFYRVVELPASGDGSYKFSYSPMEVPSAFVPALKRDGRWRLSSCVLPCCGRRHIFSYHGELDDEGRPHGIGRWRDSQSRGESLKGLWRHGVPIGPFVSSEQGAGFGFRAVQIAFATCDAKSQLWDANAGGGTRVGPLHWGVAATETSVTGLYYKHLPSANLLCGPTSGVGADWAIHQMTQTRMESEDGVLTVALTAPDTHGATQCVVNGYEPMPAAGGGAHPEHVTIEAIRPTRIPFHRHIPDTATSASTPLGVAEADQALAQAPTQPAALPLAQPAGPPLAQPAAAPPAQGPRDTTNRTKSTKRVRLTLPPAPIDDGGDGDGHSPLPVRRAAIETPPPRPSAEAPARHTAIVAERSGGNASDNGGSNTTDGTDDNGGGGNDTGDKGGGGGGTVNDHTAREKVYSKVYSAILEDVSTPSGLGLTHHRAIEPRLRVVGWQPQARSEALLFIHGWTAGNKWAHHNLAQFLNLSRLGPHIRPFVFAWPCGLTIPSFCNRARFCDHNPELHRALAQMIKELAAAGIRRLHVFAHSMGARLFCAALPLIEEFLIGGRASGERPPQHANTRTDAADVRAAAADATPPTHHRLQLSTCTLLHPEHDLHTFIRRDYPPLRALCEVVTLYMDRSDQALWWAEVFNRAPSLGKHPYALVSGGADGLERQSVLTTLRGYELDADLMITPSQERPALDLDVIDTSWMDTNAGATSPHVPRLPRPSLTLCGVFVTRVPQPARATPTSMSTDGSLMTLPRSS